VTECFFELLPIDLIIGVIAPLAIAPVARCGLSEKAFKRATCGFRPRDHAWNAVLPGDEGTVPESDRLPGRGALPSNEFVSSFPTVSREQAVQALEEARVSLPASAAHSAIGDFPAQ